MGSIPAASAINQRRFGTTGMLVSELGLGAMTFGRESDEAQSRAVLDRYLDAGGNLIDTGWQIAQALGRSLLNRWEPFVSVQPQYSLAERGAEREVIPAAKAFGLAVVPWSPLAGGLLTGKYAPGVAPPGATRLAGTTAGGVRARSWFDAGSKDAIVHAVREVAAAVDHSPAQVALNWVLNRPGVTAPIVGARTPEQLDADLSATGWHLDDEHRRRLDDASAIERGYPYDFIDEVLAR